MFKVGLLYFYFALKCFLYRLYELCIARRGNRNIVTVHCKEYGRCKMTVLLFKHILNGFSHNVLIKLDFRGFKVVTRISRNSSAYSCVGCILKFAPDIIFFPYSAARCRPVHLIIPVVPAVKRKARSVHLRSVRRFPDIFRVRLIVRDSAVKHHFVYTEIGEYLRILPRLSPRRGRISDGIMLRPVLIKNLPAVNKVAHKRLVTY